MFVILYNKTFFVFCNRNSPPKINVFFLLKFNINIPNNIDFIYVLPAKNACTKCVKSLKLGHNSHLRANILFVGKPCTSRASLKISAHFDYQKVPKMGVTQ